MEVTLADATYDEKDNTLECVFSYIRNGISKKENLPVVFSSNYKLHCTCYTCEQHNWCPHLRAVMSAGGDAPLLMQPDQVSVPIVPADGIFATILLEDYKVTGALKTRSVMYNFTDRSGRIVCENLGFIFEGESLVAIREMVIAFFNGKKADSSRFYQNCAYKRHSHYTIYGAGKNHKVQPFTNAWMIAHTGFCSACTELGKVEVPDV